MTLSDWLRAVTTPQMARMSPRAWATAPVSVPAFVTQASDYRLDPGLL
jgi:hypothetical protein